MILFPTLCVENFYEDPNSVREFALKQEYFQSPGNYAGKRSKQLHELSPNLFSTFCNKLFSIYYDFNTNPMEWEVDVTFNILTPYDADEKSIKNTGWIHTDTKSLFAGIIYLTPDINPECGTSVYEKISDDYKNQKDVKFNLYKNGVAEDDHDEVKSNHEKCFRETIRFSNVYNRMVCFDSTMYHSANSFYSKTPRLTQTFFVRNFKSNSPPPLQRMMRVK